MSIATGTLLGPYEIVALVGKGGMGEVYRARDTRLHRQVAIKVLAVADTGNELLRNRLEREARVIAALSHPHICSLYDVGSDGDVQFLIMEYLDGETLAASLARRRSRARSTARTPAAPDLRAGLQADPASSGPACPMPIDEALRIGTQLADALAAAHRAGVIHRDLKPGNVMLTTAGVKVLDFGLAKLRAPSVAAEESEDQSTTVAAPLTGAGVILGTLPYMAPEQVEGRDADHRTDIFALGGILYEMVAGKRAFTGESPASLTAAILEHEPEPIDAALPPALRGLERLIRKCLAKDPESRWQSAKDVADELRWLGAESGSNRDGIPTRPASWGSLRWQIAVGALLALAAISLSTWWWLSARGQDGAVAVQVRHRQLTFSGDVRLAALSPDGRTMAYVTGENEVRVLVRDLAGGQALELWKAREVHELQWLPDGSFLVAAGNKLSEAPGIWLLPRLGGVPRRLPDNGGGSFAPSPDGAQIAMAFTNEKGFRVASVDGSVSRGVEMKGFQWVDDIEWSATTNRVVLLTSDDDGTSIIWAATPDGRQVRQVHTDQQTIRAICSSPATDALYMLRQRDDANELLRVHLAGEGDTRASVLLTGLPIAPRTLNRSEPCSISGNADRLLHLRGTLQSNLWQLDVTRRGAPASILTPGTATFSSPAVSPDGRWLAASQGVESLSQIVKLAMDAGEPIRLGAGMSPVWSPDGTKLGFASSRTGSRRVWLSDSDGQRLTEVNDSATGGEVTWFPDGRLAWLTPDSRNFRIRDLTSGREETLVKNPKVGWVFSPRFSPRGDKVAVNWNRSRKAGQVGLWLLSWPSRGERFLARI